MAVTERRRVELTDETMLAMYERMVLIRVFEETTMRQFADGQIPGFVHLYAGEEAVAVGVCAHLGDADYITSTHRGHGHCIAKGVDVTGMVGRADGQGRPASARARAARCTSPTWTRACSARTASSAAASRSRAAPP